MGFPSSNLAITGGKLSLRRMMLCADHFDSGVTELEAMISKHGKHRDLSRYT